MIAPVRVSLLVLGIATLVACGPRQVEVRTAPEATDAQTSLSVQFTNNLSQAMNVYVTATDGNELFLRQIGANTVAVLSQLTTAFPLPDVRWGRTQAT